jgi:hypothetical protein
MGGTHTGRPSVFMKYNEICDVICTASLREIFHHVVTAVNPEGIGKYQAHLL